MIYSYQVKKRHMTDTEMDCLLGGDEVLSNLSPRELRTKWCADFQFPNGDTFVLKPDAVILISAIAIE